MKDKQKQQYLNSLLAAQCRFDKDVSALGEKIRTQVIIPLCQKHKLHFKSGMGAFFFVDANGRIYNDPHHDDCWYDDPVIFQAVKPILLFLEEKVSHNQCLGYYVGDVK
jgi:hypothetical protein